MAWSDGRKELQQYSATSGGQLGKREGGTTTMPAIAASRKNMRPYMQVVWRTTTSVGCAMAVCDDTRTQVWCANTSLQETGWATNLMISAGLLAQYGITCAVA